MLAELIALHKGDEGRAELSSKLLSSTTGLTIDEVMPDAYGRA